MLPSLHPLQIIPAVVVLRQEEAEEKPALPDWAWGLIIVGSCVFGLICFSLIKNQLIPRITTFLYDNFPNFYNRISRQPDRNEQPMDVNILEPPALLFSRAHTLSTGASASNVSSETASAVKALKEAKAGAEQKMEDCPICMEELGLQMISSGPCQHLFHSSCLKSWLIFDDSLICPICRSDVTAKEEDAPVEGHSVS